MSSSSSNYPAIRQGALRRVYLACELGSLAVALGFLLPWAWAWRGKRAQSEQACALMIAIVELATLLGPWLGDPFTAWEYAQLVYVVMYSLLLLLQGGTLWSRSSPSV